ncbi:hypothetical protein M378DRAFT_155935 [Amanita muscaria Koide BX008]|uniref:Mediator of RNA polymerase II transcription subunit 6 n=1 Tax=Amanita muscaria (strain Koide BX008) TaxID=946122 RepID=A0A0C2T4Z4_AMAMK|nr:hypothetical protein M378DRAFT_155935 [Amanita muscaria Koide BX008]
MDIIDLHPPDDYSHRFFIWHEWIQANGLLTTENVFEYFATSMFYDKQSNNQVLRMQTMHTGQSIANEAEELRRFTGIEFALVHSQPPSFFVIQKRERLSPEEALPLASYFIMNNRIYQAPDLYTVLSNRLLTSLYSLQSSLDILRQYRPEYTPRTGFVWPIVDPASVSDDKKKTDDDASMSDAGENLSDMPTRREDSSKRQQNNLLLLNAMRTTAAHMKTLPASGSSVLGTSAPAPPSAVLPSQPLPPALTPSSSRGTTPAVGIDAAKAPVPIRKRRKRASLASPGS